MVEYLYKQATEGAEMTTMIATNHRHYMVRPSSATARKIRATVLGLAALTGHSDGATWATCMACGENCVVGGAPSARDTFNMGHVLADANGGGYCPCNLVPLCRQCNEEMGDDTLTDVVPMPYYDNREMWDGVLFSDPGTETRTVTRGRAAWRR
jgi:hypothetical protein